MDIPVNIRDGFTQEIADRGHADDPSDPSHYVIEGKSTVPHVADSRYDGRKGAQDRHEPGEDNGYAAMAIVELFGADEMFFMKEE
jgi:hypothetical protein